MRTGGIKKAVGKGAWKLQNTAERNTEEFVERMKGRQGPACKFSRISEPRVEATDDGLNFEFLVPELRIERISFLFE